MEKVNVIGERLRLLRDENGISQQELADKLGVNRMTINNYENGRRTPDIAFATMAAANFDVTLEYLTGKSEFRNREDMLESVDKVNRLMLAVEKLPQTEGQQMVANLARLLDAASDSGAGMPVLMGLMGTIAEFNRVLTSYMEIEENLTRTVSELRWQKVTPALIQWTCLEKTKAVSESSLEAVNGISAAVQLCSKMLSKRLVKVLEIESEK